ncbi:hypothetical protein ACFCP7_24825 [Paenibacillus elgii]
MKHHSALEHIDFELGLNKTQHKAISQLESLKVLYVKDLDAALLAPNPKMKRLYVESNLLNPEKLADLFPNLEVLYVKRQLKEIGGIGDYRLPTCKIWLGAFTQIDRFKGIYDDGFGRVNCT